MEQVDVPEWLVELENGSTEAFAAFYDLHAKLVYQIAFSILKNKEDAEDITHDVFLEAYKKIKTYDPNKGSISSWLAVRTKSRCIDQLRKKRYTLTPLEYEQLKTDDSVVEEAVFKKLDQAIVHKALRRLPFAQQKAIYGSFFEEKSHAELSKQLGSPLGTIKSWIRYGINNIRKELVPRGDKRNGL